MKSVHILSYFLNKVGGSRLKLQVTLAGSSATANVWAPAWAGHPFQPLTLQSSSTLRQGEGWGECSIVRNRAAQTRLGMASEQWGGSHYCIYGGSPSGTVWNSDWDRDNHSSSPDPQWAPAPASLVPALLPSGARVPMLEEGKSIHFGTEPAQTKTLRTSASATWNLPLLPIRCVNHWAEEKPWLWI